METKTHAPSFTVSLRGYDREEVDEYLDSLAEALAQVEQAEERSRRLQQHVARANARIKELEDRIRTETPKSGVALGERIGLLLREAEEAAAATLTRAESDATRIIAGAEARSAEAEELMRSITSRAEEQARRIEAVARGESAEIISEAEARAAARTRQIEQWAEQVVSHTRAEEARMLAEHQRMRLDAEAQLQALASQRAEARRTLTELREVLGRAVGLLGEDDEPGPDAAEEPRMETRIPDPDPEPDITAEDRMTDADLEPESSSDLLVAEDSHAVAEDSHALAEEPHALAEEPDSVRDTTVEIESLPEQDDDYGADEEPAMIEAAAEPMAGFYASAPEPQTQLFDGEAGDCEAEDREAGAGDAGAGDATPPDGMPVIKVDPQFEAKLDAWVAGADED